MASEVPAKQRINMAHGFMKSVIKNQIDRDNYDKEVKAQQKQDKRHNRQQSNKHKKPEQQTYVPPQRSKKDKGAHLYVLEYKHEDGEIYSIGISKHDAPRAVASEIGEKFQLSEDFIDVLTRCIKDEIDKRSSV